MSRPASRHQADRTTTTATQILREAAGSISRAEAEFLLMHLLKVPRHELYAGHGVATRTAARFRRLVSRTRTGEPVQYLTGSAPFLDFEVHVDRRVLIPRPETEELVARTLRRLRSEAKSQKPRAKTMVLDYGTGSGCIAIALARALPEAEVIAADSSKAALSVALKNVTRLGLAGRIRLARASSFAAPVLARLHGQCGLLISNPPYVPTSRLARLDRNVRHEPRPALDGGPKGANIVAMLLTRGPDLLLPGGLLALEIDSTHAAFVRRLAPTAEVERDLSGRTRYAFLTR